MKHYLFVVPSLGGGGAESTRNVIGHAGTETDDDDIITGGKFHKVGRPGITDLPALKNRIIKQIRQFFSFAGRDVGGDGVNVTDADFADFEGEKLFDLSGNAGTAGIAPLGKRGDFNPVICHFFQTLMFKEKIF